MIKLLVILFIIKLYARNIFIFNNDCWTSTEVLWNLVAPLDSAMPSLDFEQVNVFRTSGFDSVSIVFDSLSVS